MQMTTRTAGRTRSRRGVRGLTSALMVALVTSAAMLGITAPAMAASDVACAHLDRLGTATGNRFAVVYNTCTGPITVKLDISGGSDSACTYIGRYDVAYIRYSLFNGGFNRIIDC